MKINLSQVTALLKSLAGFASLLKNPKVAAEAGAGVVAVAASLLGVHLSTTETVAFLVAVGGLAQAFTAKKAAAAKK